MSVNELPTLNAALNATAAVLLACGYLMIRRRQVALHRASMLGAFSASLLFLISYTVYHAQAGSHPFPGSGPARAIYLAILMSHVVLAAVILPMALLTLARALRARYALHKRIARVTLPIWMYVSITGVIIYVMLYRMNW